VPIKSGREVFERAPAGPSTRLIGTNRPEVYLNSGCGILAGPVASAGEAPWLAAYTRPRHEHKVEDYFRQREWEVFWPTVRVRRQWSDRCKTIAAPLFPSYVFVRLTEAERRRAVQAPGFLWFVRNERGPAPVAAEELAAIERLLASGWRFDPLPAARLGDEVEIVGGALRGCRGRLVRKSAGAIALVVSAINGGLRVTVPDPAWIRVLPARRGGQRTQ
jgi:transcription antitermination factor NusG